MIKDTRKLIHRIYNIAVSIVIGIVGIRFILACYGIYTAGKAAGGQIYSRSAVYEAFRPMAISVYICLALVVLGFILHIALPVEEKKVAPEKNRTLILERLRAKTDMDLIDPDLYRTIARLKMGRWLHTLISFVLLAVFSAIFLVYACSPQRWPEVSQVTGTVVHTVFVMLLCLVIPVGYAIFASYYCRNSLDKEIQLMKEASKQASVQPRQTPPAPAKGNYLVFVRYGILVLAVACMIYGYLNDGIVDVIAKAAAICTECVGLG